MVINGLYKSTCKFGVCGVCCVIHVNKMETVMNRINDELVTVHTLINERKEVDLKLLNILEKLNDRNSK